MPAWVTEPAVPPPAIISVDKAPDGSPRVRLVPDPTWPSYPVIVEVPLGDERQEEEHDGDEETR